jgi:hypothetical protein
MNKFKKIFEDCNPLLTPVPSFLNSAIVNKIDEGPINFTKSFMQAGKAAEKQIDETMVDQEQLNMGIHVELEHTDNRDIAKKIALDHLSEIPDYYTRLAKMESEAKKTEK